MKPLLFELAAAPGVAAALCERAGCERGEIESRSFPDEESYVRLISHVGERDVVLLCTLDRPDPKLAPLLFTAAAAREQGARSVGLVAPYLAYMRQDRAFEPGEAITSATFAKLLSSQFDWLVTIDPHLHRHRSLAELYSIPAIAMSGSEAIGAWIRREILRPVVIGPDEESGQWAGEIAERAGAPMTVIMKTRSGDRSVQLDSTALDEVSDGNPVIVDDIASSGETMIAAVKRVRERGFPAPTCVVVHSIFSGDAYTRLLNSGLARMLSTNTVAHPSNEIDVSGALADGVARALRSV